MQSPDRKKTNILQVGMMRSGNLWTWKIIERAAELAGWERGRFVTGLPVYRTLKEAKHIDSVHGDIDVLEILPNGYSCAFLIPHLVRVRVDHFEDYLAKAWHVWTHSAWNRNSKNTYTKFSKIVYILRDPRDVLISLSQFYFSVAMNRDTPRVYQNPMAYLDANIEAHARIWTGHVGRHLLAKEELGIHFLIYDRLLQDTETHVRDLLAYLNIPLSEADLQELLFEMKFEQLKPLDPNHLRNGRLGQWAEVLNKAQKRRFLKIAGPLLEYLNFPLGAYPSETHPLASIPEPLSCARIRRMIRKAHARPWSALWKRGVAFLAERLSAW
jgi:aryl sulfotransferase